MRSGARVAVAFAGAALVGASLLSPATALTAVAHGIPEARFDRPFTGFASASTVLTDRTPSDAGLDAKPIDDALASIAACTHSPTTVDRLRGWFGDVRGRGACHYPDGVVRFVATALDVFGDEVARHDRDGRCLASPPAALPIPASDGSWQ